MIFLSDHFDERNIVNEEMEPLIKELIEIAEEAGIPIIVAWISSIDPGCYTSGSFISAKKKRTSPEFFAACQLLSTGFNEHPRHVQRIICELVCKEPIPWWRRLWNRCRSGAA